MKKLKFFTIASITFLLFACGGGQEKNIEGNWKLQSIQDNGEKIQLTECDNLTTWEFTAESAEALDDGTKVKKLNGKAPENCKFYSFDAKWTMKDGKLFISTSRVGGMGGFSMAGLLEIVNLTDKKLVVKSMSKELTFKK